MKLYVRAPVDVPVKYCTNNLKHREKVTVGDIDFCLCPHHLGLKSHILLKPSVLLLAMLLLSICILLF